MRKVMYLVSDDAAALLDLIAQAVGSGGLVIERHGTFEDDTAHLPTRRVRNPTKKRRDTTEMVKRRWFRMGSSPPKGKALECEGWKTINHHFAQHRLDKMARSTATKILKAHSWSDGSTTRDPSGVISHLFSGNHLIAIGEEDQL